MLRHDERMNWRKGLTRFGLAYFLLWLVVGGLGAWLYAQADGPNYDMAVGSQLIESALLMGILLPLAAGIVGGVGWWIWRGFRS